MKLVYIAPGHCIIVESHFRTRGKQHGTRREDKRTGTPNVDTVRPERETRRIDRQNRQGDESGQYAVKLRVSQLKLACADI